MSAPSHPQRPPLSARMAASDVRPPAPVLPTIVVDGLDDSHIGVALNWLTAQIAGDEATLAMIRDTVSAPESLRSGVEMILGLVDWVSVHDPDSYGDGGSLVLAALAENPFLPTPQRRLCEEMSRALAEDASRDSIPLTAVPVVEVMRLCLFLATLIHYRFGISVEHQLETYRRYMIEQELHPTL